MRDKVGPDFMCIGAPRSGTTWLHGRLLQHPSMTPLPVKELRHFSDNQWSRREKEKKAADFLEGSPARQERWGAWMAKWVAAPNTDEAYMSLFEGIDTMTADFSPSYCSCDAPTVERIKALVGDVPIILCMRDPVERDWSQAKITLGRRGRFDDEDSIAFFGTDFCSLRSDYLRTLGIWGQHFEVLPVFFDDIGTDPRAVLSAVCAHVGLSAEPVLAKLGDQHPSKAPLGEMSDRVREFLREKHRPMIERMADTMGGPARSWLEQHYGVPA